MKPEQCPNWSNCNTPVCPLDKDSTENTETNEGEEECKMWKDRKWRMALPKEVRKGIYDGKFLKNGFYHPPK